MKKDIQTLKSEICVVFVDLKAFCRGSISICFKAYEIVLLQHYIHIIKISLHTELVNQEKGSKFRYC